MEPTHFQVGSSYNALLFSKNHNSFTKIAQLRPLFGIKRSQNGLRALDTLRDNERGYVHLSIPQTFPTLFEAFLVNYGKLTCVLPDIDLFWASADVRERKRERKRE